MGGRTKVAWSEARFIEIVGRLSPYLKQVGFREKTVWYVPCSGFLGENIVKRTEPRLAAWYTGPTLVEQIGAHLGRWASTFCAMAED